MALKMDADAALSPPPPRATSSAVALEARGLRKEVSTGSERIVILESVDLRITRGERVAIIGRSGSGKSTLLSLLAGLDRPSQGTIALCGQSLTTLDEDGLARLRAGRVAFVFQSFQLLAGLTALENVMLPAELAGRADAAARAQRMLAQVGLGERLRHYPPQLSGGEQQRVALARAFAADPEILFADEPTGNLDAATGARIIDMMFELNQSLGTTLVLVTHDAELARRCDRALTLVNGRLNEPTP